MATFSIYKDEMELTDFDSNFEIWSYKDCTRESPDELKNLRGMIYDYEARLIHSTSYTDEYTTNELLPPIDYEKCRFTLAEEGTLIRLFYNTHDSIWMITTQRKLDAYHSKWGDGGSTFGDVFTEALDRHSMTPLDLVNQLNTGYVYLFFIRATADTKFVCSEPPQGAETIYFVEKVPVGMSREVLLQNPTEGVDDGLCGIPSQPALPIRTEEELISFVSGIDCFVAQGVLASHPETGKRIRILNQTYADYKEIRGNEPGILSRYLKIRADPPGVDNLKKLYPEYETVMDIWEQCVQGLVKNIHRAYIQRHVQKTFHMMTPAVHNILKKAHLQYTTTKRRIFPETIQDILQANQNIFYTLVKLELE